MFSRRAKYLNQKLSIPKEGEGLSKPEAILNQFIVCGALIWTEETTAQGLGLSMLEKPYKGRVCITNMKKGNNKGRMIGIEKQPEMLAALG